MDTNERIARLAAASPHDVENALAVWESITKRPRPQDDRSCAALVRFALAYADSIATPPDQAVQRTQGPADWRLHSLAVLDAHRGVQRRVLGLFGLDSPVASWEEAHTFLRGVMRAAPKSGDARSLHLEDKNGLVVEYLVYDGIEDGTAVSPEVPLPPLFELAGESMRLARTLGAPQERVVAWLLAGVTFDLPWISGYLTKSGVLGTTSAVVHVTSTEALPEEVAEAYDRLRAHQVWVLEDGPVSHQYKRTRTTDRISAMAALVDAHKATTARERVESWEALREAFNVKHPEHKPFANAETMRVQYADLKRRRKAIMDKKGGETQ